MGTRSLTIVYDERQQPILNLYRQYDGYPSGHGAELARFLERGRLVNGLSGRDEPVFNGMGCLAAQMVANFKQTAGGFYIHSVEERDCGQDYEYHVYPKGGLIHVRVVDRGCNMFGLTMDDRQESIYDGPVGRFEEFCEDRA
jgi:hypothetical protein